MSQTSGKARPIACNMDVFTAEERQAHQALFERLSAAMLSRELLPDGIRFGIRPGAETLHMLAEFIDGERRCCPFFTFSVRLEPDSAALWLDLTGPDGMREFIGQAFGGAAANGASISAESM